MSQRIGKRGDQDEETAAGQRAERLLTEGEKKPQSKALRSQVGVVWVSLKIRVRGVALRAGSSSQRSNESSGHTSGCGLSPCPCV